jgi:hypothetical protein
MNCDICLEQQPEYYFWKCTCCKNGHCYDCHEKIIDLQGKCPFCRTKIHYDTSPLRLESLCVITQYEMTCPCEMEFCECSEEEGYDLNSHTDSESEEEEFIW